VKGGKIMKKRNVLFMAVFVVALSLVIAVPTSACEHGCTPGYWKQEHHFDSWVDYAPGDYFDEVFGVGQHITLLDALKAKGGGENALMRHAVAALLNAAHPEVVYFPESLVIGDVQMWWEGIYTAEELKDFFEEYNEYGCPLN
jgi:hypothetical protein